MNLVEPGQVWQLRDVWSPLYQFRIVSIDGGWCRGVRVASGRPCSIPLSVFRTGKRAARLVLDAEGNAVTRKKPYAKFNERKARLVVRLRAEGKDWPELAEEFGVHVKVVQRWVREVSNGS
jgi:hypothetical protein